ENSSYTINAATITVHGDVYVKTTSTISIETGGNLKIGRFWTKRIPIIISTSVSPDIPDDYQIWVPTTVFTTAQWSDIKGGTGQADLDDVRFVSSMNATGYWENCPYWIDPNVASPKGFWVKISSINQANSNVYMHYGNADATAQSDIGSTFVREISGIKAVWSLDENSGTVAYDKSGNGYNGTILNGPQVVEGRFGNALNFDGSNDKIDLPTAIPAINNSSFAWTLWLKTAASSSGLLTKRGTSADQPINIMHIESGKAYFWMQWVAGGGGGTATSLLDDNEWHYFVAQRNTSNNTIEIWVDGVRELLVPGTTGDGVGGIAQFTMGANHQGNSNFFTGILDEVIIYQKFLSSEEIADLYAGVPYTTLDYSGNVLVRKNAEGEPTISAGAIEDTPTTGYHIYIYSQGQIYQQQGSGINK
ncbi:MAG: DUF2341 domain-containing protein, partial [Elusimicrobiales bacterium]|nr:DUF2341 domain-containing protein [Elusimicrobiales bacterium]